MRKIFLIIILLPFAPPVAACFQVNSFGGTSSIQSTHNVGVYDATSVSGQWSLTTSYYDPQASQYTPTVADLVIPTSDGFHNMIVVPLSSSNSVEPPKSNSTSGQIFGRKPPSIDCSPGGGINITLPNVVVNYTPYALLPAWFNPGRFNIIIVPAFGGGSNQGDSPDNPNVVFGVAECSTDPLARREQAENLICASVGTRACTLGRGIGEYFEIIFTGDQTGIYHWALPMQSSVPVEEIEAPDC